MKPLRRRILIVTAVVLDLYVGACSAYVAANLDDFKGADFAEALTSMLLGASPLLLIGWLVCIQIATYKFFPRDRATAAAQEESADDPLFKQEYGANGLPLTNGFDALGNFQGIDVSSHSASTSDD